MHQSTVPGTLQMQGYQKKHDININIIYYYCIQSVLSQNTKLKLLKNSLYQKRPPDTRAPDIGFCRVTLKLPSNTFITLLLRVKICPPIQKSSKQARYWVYRESILQIALFVKSVKFKKILTGAFVRRLRLSVPHFLCLGYPCLCYPCLDNPCIGYPFDYPCTIVH